MIRGVKSVTVLEVIKGRYKNLKQPSDWKDRASGIDIIKGDDGFIYRLYSESDQSVPRPGSVIVLEPCKLESDQEQIYRWTLYGFKETTKVGLDEF